MNFEEIATMHSEIHAAHNQFTRLHGWFDTFKAAAARMSFSESFGIKLANAHPLQFSYLGQTIELSFEFDTAKSRGNIVAEEIVRDQRRPIARIEYDLNGVVVGDPDRSLNLSHHDPREIVVLMLMHRLTGKAPVAALLKTPT